jgi:hypothetical protein
MRPRRDDGIALAAATTLDIAGAAGPAPREESESHGVTAAVAA